MKVLIIGSGGREHALAFKAAQHAQHVYVAPGNAGTAQESGVSNIALDPMDFDALIEFAKQQHIELTIVGPEAPLVGGIVDAFQAQGLAIFGPNQNAAQLEGSKSFSKDFLARHQIPTAAYQTFHELEPALAYIRSKGAPIVIKADGLAAGKGVIVAQTLAQAEQAVRDMLAGNRFGDAGHKVVIEEFLAGEEASFIVMVDGEHILPMATSQDHKPVGEGDSGANTGGMGAYSPAPVVDDATYERIMHEVITPTVKAMAQDGNPYTGFLYVGLMIDPQGAPKVIEFNCRFGDPETQPIMLRLKSNLLEHCMAALKGELDQQTAIWDNRKALGVVLAAQGYPNEYRKGERIQIKPYAQDGVKLFHAGTQLDAQGESISVGGRVLCATALGESVKQAQAHAHALIEQVQFAGMFYRTDIGYRAIAREDAES